MVAVGIFAAMTGGAARWTYPCAFVGAMVLGGALGYGGAALPVVEPTILASVLVLGAAMLFALRPPLAAGLRGDRAVRHWRTATRTASRRLLPAASPTRLVS